MYSEFYSETFGDRILVRKELVDAISNPTDSNGEATWLRLRFSTAGSAGFYSAVFYQVGFT